MLLTASDARDVLRLLGVERAANAHRQQLGVTADCVQRGTQLVTHAREKFRFRLTGSPSFFFRILSLFDVHGDSKPGVDFPCLVTMGPAPRQEPAVPPIRLTQSKFYLEVLPGMHGSLPATDYAIVVLGMNCVGPSE